MPVFKVWNGDRTMRKMIVASTIRELKSKGCEKLCIDKEKLDSIVLDVDGTDIDDDEILLQLEKETFLFLQQNEKWEPPSDNKNSTLPSKSDDSMNKSTPAPKGVTLEPPVSDHVECHEESTSSCVQNEASSSDSIENTDVVPNLKSVDLPTFSPMVQKCLDEQKPEIIWNQLVSETASYYFVKLKDVSDQNCYRQIGEKMFLSYPCIRMEGGTHAWTFFTRSLSQKIRHMRHNLKVKSQNIGSTGMMEKTTTPPKKFRILPEVPRSAQKTEVEIQTHISKLKDEWKKMQKNRDVRHIKMLLRETLEYRDELLRKNPQSLLKDVMTEFPCFGDALYVLFEFNVRYGDAKLEEVAKNLKRLISAAHEMAGKKTEVVTEGPETMTDVIHYVENATKFDRSGKGKENHFQSIIEVYNDVEDSDIQPKLASKDRCPPHLKIFKKNSSITGIYIVGDTKHIKCQGSSVTSAVLQLIALYYIFDIDYPKCYAMVLGLLQTFVMSEPFTYETSKKFKFFCKKFRPIFDGIEVVRQDDKAM